MRVLLLTWIGLALATAGPASAARIGSIEFAPCELSAPGAPQIVAAECGTLAVPENPSAPEGRQITLRIGRLPARTAEPASDPMFFFAGGPGQAATEGIVGATAGFARLREKRDLYLIDQRGTGGSNLLACDTPDEIGNLSDFDREAQQKMARDCLAKNAGSDVRYYATSHFVADVEAVRKALGLGQINLYGGSYGTRSAQEYLRRYPQSVRSVILDAVAPPQLVLGGEHAINLDTTLKQILDRCTDDDACKARFGDSYQTLFALRDRLRAAPMPASYLDPRSGELKQTTFGEGQLATVARLFAYAPETAALLPLLIHEASEGRPGPLLAQAASISNNLGGSIALGMHLSVSCSEDADRLRANPEDEQRLLGNQIVEMILTQCEIWPHAEKPVDFNEPLTTDAPMLILSGELDPVTPPRYGEQVLQGKSNARHLVGKGQGHILIVRGCMPRLAAEFVDKLDPRGLDASCLDALGPTPFFLTFNGAAP